MTNYSCPIEEASRKFPQNPAVITKDEIMSYQQLDRMVRNLSGLLLHKGVTRGDVVLLTGESNLRFIAAFWAIIRTGSIVCPISLNLTDESLEQTILTTKAGSLVSVDSRQSERFPESITVISFDTTTELQQIDDRGAATIKADQPITAILTSGTSSSPKIAVHSFANFYHSASGINSFIDFDRDDRWLLTLPLHHVGGLAILFRAALAGGSVVIPDPERSINDTIQEQRVSHLSIVALQLKRLLDDIDSGATETATLKSVLIGGSAISTSLVKQAKEIELALAMSYGLTEMSSTVTASFPGDVASYSSGCPLNGRELKISDSGEILVRGETLFLGYLKDGQIELPIDSDGWFATGDIGYLDKDSSLCVTGRSDAMFISGGENIHPEEIERAMYEYPGLNRVIVVSVRDEKYGQRPAAFVDLESKELFDESELRRYLTVRLEKFKIPDYFFPWPNKDQEGIKPLRCEFARLAAVLLKESS